MIVHKPAIVRLFVLLARTMRPCSVLLDREIGIDLSCFLRCVALHTACASEA